MAGTGKSTISRSVAQAFTDLNCLGASFFFKRGEADRGNATKLFPTIAKQLAIGIPGLLPHMLEAIRDNPELSGKGIRVQFDTILIGPLRKLSDTNRQEDVTSIALVIDALDECDSDKDIRCIIQLLPELNKINAIKLRVFLTSRPELPTKLGFRRLSDKDHEDLILHEIPHPVISHDIALFLDHHISAIRKERDHPLPLDWPGEKAMKNRALRSSFHFCCNHLPYLQR